MRAFLKICNRQLSHYTVSNNFLRKKSIITQGFVVVDPLEAFYCGFLTIFWPRCTVGQVWPSDYFEGKLSAY